jgi:hypothetical protein
MGTPVLLMLNQNLDTATNSIGDTFAVVVAEDVIAEGTIVIPKGAAGTGEVTFLTNRGGYGKPGIIQIAVRHVELGDRRILLDGRFREEGQSKAGAAAATWFAVGIFSGFVKGKPGAIERGRALRARLGEDFEYVPGAPPPPVPAFPVPGETSEAPPAPAEPVQPQAPSLSKEN